MICRVSMILLLMTSTIGLTCGTYGAWEGCSGRLERALDTLHGDSPRRSVHEEEDDEAGIIYQQELRSAPLDMTVSRVAVKLPQDLKVRASPWAQVERCVYEPSNNSLQTRLVFNDLSVSGLVSLLPRDYRVPIPAESCRMTLRLRRAGIEFYTSPIARERGQMRIRTESSFLEPRFASIYAFGCRPTRLDKQIKRQDKWPPQSSVHAQHDNNDEFTIVPSSPQDNYEAAEPRELANTSKEENVAIANESRQTRALYTPDAQLGIWRKNIWITRPAIRRKRLAEDIASRNVITVNLADKLRLSLLDLQERNNRANSAEASPCSSSNSSSVKNLKKTTSQTDNEVSSGYVAHLEEPIKQIRLSNRNERSAEDITPRDFVLALAKKAKSLLVENEEPSQNNDISMNTTTIQRNSSKTFEKYDNNINNNIYQKVEAKANFKRETIDAVDQQNPEEARELLLEEDPDDAPLVGSGSEGRGWQSREVVAREMEDVFLRGASQALTSYIERQLHPAIKETLMRSMGYTISYG